MDRDQDCEADEADKLDQALRDILESPTCRLDDGKLAIVVDMRTYGRAMHAAGALG